MSGHDDHLDVEQQACVRLCQRIHDLAAEQGMKVTIVLDDGKCATVRGKHKVEIWTDNGEQVLRVAHAECLDPVPSWELDQQLKAAIRKLAAQS